MRKRKKTKRKRKKRKNENGQRIERKQGNSRKFMYPPSDDMYGSYVTVTNQPIRLQ